jgi:hypothetical protein
MFWVTIFIAVMQVVLFLMLWTLISELISFRRAVGTDLNRIEDKTDSLDWAMRAIR